MQLLIPAQATLQSSTVSHLAPPAYLRGTSYSAGERVSVCVEQRNLLDAANWTETRGGLGAGYTAPLPGARSQAFTASDVNGVLEQDVPCGVGEEFEAIVWLRRQFGSGRFEFRGVNDVVNFVTVTDQWQRYAIRTTTTTDAAYFRLRVTDPGDVLELYSPELRRAPADATQRIYEALSSGAHAAPPVGGNAQWADVSATNRYRMFDGLNNSATEAQGDLTVTLRTDDPVSHVALLGVGDAASVTVTQTVGGNVASSQTIDLTRVRGDWTWYAWLFGPSRTASAVAIALAGPFGTQDITITLTGTPNARCAQCLICQGHDLGVTEESAEPRLQSYSVFEPDAFGNYNFTPRQNTRAGTYRVIVPTDEVDAVYQLLERNENRLVVLNANNAAYQTAFESLLAYGKVTDFTPAITYAKSRYDLKIEGLN